MGVVSVSSKSIGDASLHRPCGTWARLDVTPFVFGVYPLIALLPLSGVLEADLLAGLVCALGVIAHLLVLLFCLWSVSFLALCRYNKVSSLENATHIKVNPIAHRGKSALVALEKKDGKTCFHFQRRKFIYDESTKAFAPVRFQCNDTLGHYRASKGHTAETHAKVLNQYDANTFNIPVPTFSDLYKEHAVAPFFVFQIFCVGLWLLDEYWYYALFTLFMLLVFEATVVKQRMANLQHIRNLAPKPYSIAVFRDKKWSTVSTQDLVAGDLVSLARPELEEHAVPCDLLILEGSCIINEAMLTGESIPQLKENIHFREQGDSLRIEHDKRHIAFGGTRVVNVTQAEKGETSVRTPDGGCLAYVLRTGFETGQGKLMRTILFSSEHATANNGEAFAFILLLLVFALVAAYYVLTEGLKDETRSRYKLLLNCTFVITNVVPPELPMELSLAVNNSLMALAKLGIYCTEPFRIPFGGKLNLACFDKTGTLTEEKLVVRGVAEVDPATTSVRSQAGNPAEVAADTALVLAGCHSLVVVRGETVGDPMEQATLEAAGWTFSSSDVAASKQGKMRVRVVHRHAFASALKRMSVVAAVEHTMPHQYRALSKGAPEVIRNLLAVVPKGYDEVYSQFTRNGMRVLALAWKELPTISNPSAAKELLRAEVECKLTFAGFLVFHCPLKPTSKQAIEELKQSQHKVVMITGDNPLTAAHVARELAIADHEVLTLYGNDNSSNNNNSTANNAVEEEAGSTIKVDSLEWRSGDDSIRHKFTSDVTALAQLRQKFELNVTGSTLNALRGEHTPLEGLVRHVSVYSRMSPEQKEWIMTQMSKMGYQTLMCGDGTNDVGALKQASVGIALLNHAPVKKNSNGAGGSEPASAPVSMMEEYKKMRAEMMKNRKDPKKGMQAMMAQMEKEMAADQPRIQLGDASIAAPFTSKSPKPTSVTDIVRQGRCTLVTTMQMYKILALNCLTAAYSLSVLYLDGVKLGDTQMTLQGMTIAVMFLFISRAKPMDRLSSQRPVSRVFSPSIMISLLGQFAIHMFCLINSVKLAQPFMPEDFKVDLEGDFAPNIVNSVVYLLEMSMLVCTYAVNYQGWPHMEGLRQNKPFLYGIVGNMFLLFALVTESSEELRDTFELVVFPSEEFRSTIAMYMLFDFVGCFVWDRVVNFVCDQCDRLMPKSM